MAALVELSYINTVSLSPCLPACISLGTEQVLWDHKWAILLAEDLGADESLGPPSPNIPAREAELVQGGEINCAR